MSEDIPAVDDPRIIVSIAVPIKGRKQPLTLKVPRFDFVDEDQHDAIDAAAQSIDEENKDLALRKRQRLADLATLKPFVTDKEFEACQTLTAGQLQAVMFIWAKNSAIPLGEYLASAASSTETTGAPSVSTSTPEAGPEETSDAA